MAADTSQELRRRVAYWPVGCTARTSLDLSLYDVAGHLLQDWSPSLPRRMAPSSFAWLRHVLDAGPEYWSMEPGSATVEPQWKQVISWMLGVVGARHALADYGYPWIAPVSSFDPRRRITAAYSSPPSWFLPSALQVLPDPQISSNLMPDYVCLQGVGGLADFTLAEAKGTAEALDKRPQCRKEWSQQARNAVVEYLGTHCEVSRSIVIATRVNPNAKRRSTRQLQIRAWNQRSESRRTDPAAALEVVTAQYFAMAYNLGLSATAGAIREASAQRSTTDDAQYSLLRIM